jgi:hypothetical protein
MHFYFQIKCIDHVQNIPRISLKIKTLENFSRQHMSNVQFCCFFADLQLRPYRTDEYIPKLFYESSRFSAHNCQWSVKARVNDNQDNPLHTVTRTLSYQLCLKTKPTSALQMSYVALKGPFGETPVAPIVYDFEFTGDSMESTYREFPLPGSNECNKMLAAKIINMRLILIQVPK